MRHRVKLLCEDRTGTGLVQVMESAVQSARSDAGKMPLGFQRHGLIAGNTELLKQCAKYTRYRFHSRPRSDHVVYVLDAYRLWDIRKLGMAPPPRQNNEDMDAYLEALTACARTEMAERAQGTTSDETWQEISGGFHAHVLVWEQESLILPVSDELGLGARPAPEPGRHRGRARGPALIRDALPGRAPAARAGT